MKISKEYSMLLDIQYIKASKKDNHSDMLYIIWKDLRDGSKHLNIIPEPVMKIYFEKPEFRNHTYNKNYAKLTEVEEKTVKYKDIIYHIVDDMGPAGRDKLNNYFTTGNYKGLKEFYIYPYVYGADYDIRVWYRHEWLKNIDNPNLEKKITSAYMDIEVDSLESVGMPDPVFNPIDLVTVIDDETDTVYTFALVGQERQPKDMLNMTEEEKEEEIKIQKMYAHRLEEQEYWTEHQDELMDKIHEMFDENYPDLEYKFFFYKDEKKMLVHLFQLINSLKRDFMFIWNIAFDIPYIIDRLNALGLNPKEVICPKDFPVKECWFKKDQINFAVKNKADYFHCTSYTLYQDQMRNYAAIRKGGSELRSNRLTFIAEKEIGDAKLDYSEEGNIKTLSYRNWLIYFLYNIKDVLLQKGIGKVTQDVETLYLTSYSNLTPYESVFKQTVKLRNVQYKAFWQQGLIPGENLNGFLFNNRKQEIEYDEEGNVIDPEESTFEGALVGDPTLNGDFGKEMYGRPTNSIFEYSIDLDMGAFYPSTIRAMNIDPSCLIFKMQLSAEQYDVRGGDLKFHGITDVQINEHNADSFNGDIAKEVMDNFITKNYLSAGHKWLNLPTVNEIYNYLKRKEKKL